ncbi:MULTISPECIES: hypothetical protein [Reichenbachiella]|uniref:Uncharacterized protein n=1 Tax=Reichenbachiella agariperforans TaxID=156994 RepID=A0A1M6L9W1_REIAG|nr:MULTISPECIES: hypothetical protein [Reichenbachiella]MBU2913844.1 hypothetical protein [Reichenbachiella agariperforans]RJE74236.1 hypothetical protein BGP76_13715 [Reichenbachiella sp. MSK19-1]SHJ67954.1 hypothetical protein SAMN04488028_101880 [Reichenbachiella agariperforans]
MHLIHQTENGQIVQADKENCFYMTYKGMEYKMNVCSFIAFKSKIDTYNLELMLMSDVTKNDLEIIPLCNKDRFLVLTLEEMIEVKHLVQGALVMLELNSIVHQRINRANLV